MNSEPQTTRKGERDTLIDANGNEVDVLILKDTPTSMLAEVIATGQKISLVKHVQ
jgi:hypothetical protein